MIVTYLMAIQLGMVKVFLNLNAREERYLCRASNILNVIMSDNRHISSASRYTMPDKEWNSA